MTLLKNVLQFRQKTKCTKFVGAITIELLRKEFINLGLNASNRDVFIEGVPNELDLLIAKKDVSPQENLVYRPADVFAVLEVKFRGSYGGLSITKIKNVFDSIKEVNQRIDCLYVSVSENRRYKYRATRENLGYACYELLTRDTNLEKALKNNRIEPTGDWQKLTKRLHDTHGIR